MLSFTHKTVDGTLIKTSNLEIQQTVPSHLVILSDYLSRGMMGSAVWGWFGPWRWGWRAGLILLYLLQYHNTHTASPLRPHREQTFTRHTITHSLTHTLCHSRTWIQSVPSHICAQFSGTKVSSKSRTHSVFLVNKRCTSSQKKTPLWNPALSSICQCCFAACLFILLLLLSRLHTHTLWAAVAETAGNSFA